MLYLTMSCFVIKVYETNFIKKNKYKNKYQWPVYVFTFFVKVKDSSKIKTKYFVFILQIP